jgi:hypothetical protein
VHLQAQEVLQEAEDREVQVVVAHREAEDKINQLFNTIHMNRIKSIVALLFATLSIIAQTEFDVIRFLQPEIKGSARYTAMAGAFGALGGDPSAIKDNPAGLGIYRSSEISAGFNSLTQSALANWSDINQDISMNKLGFNHLNYVLSLPTTRSTQSRTGLLRSNWSFGYNRVKDFSRDVRVNGGNNSESSITDYLGYFTGNIAGDDLYKTGSYDPYNNVAVPWISVLSAGSGLINEFVDSETGNTLYWASLLNQGEKVSPYYKLTEAGHHDEYSFSWSGNISNRFFLGATVNFHDISYRADSEYTEGFGQGGNMSLYNVFNSTSNGVNVNIGAIVVPTDFLRFGASVKSPMIYTVNDIHYADLKYYYDASDNGTLYTPTGDNSYKLRTPAVYSLSGSLIMGTRGVIGVEYMTSDLSGARLMNSNNEISAYRYENDTIRTLFNNQQTLKIGAEIKLSKKLSIRGGYAVTRPATSSRLAKEFIPNTVRTDMEYFVHTGTDYLTGGVGYRDTNWYVDLAFMNMITNENFYPYNSTKLSNNLAVRPATVKTDKTSLVATIGFKF